MGSFSVEEQDMADFHELKSGQSNFWKKDDSIRFASRYLDEKDTSPDHADIKRLQDLLIDHPQSLALPHSDKIGLINLGMSLKQGHDNYEAQQAMQSQIKANALFVVAHMRTGSIPYRNLPIQPSVKDTPMPYYGCGG